MKKNQNYSNKRITCIINKKSKIFNKIYFNCEKKKIIKVLVKIMIKLQSNVKVVWKFYKNKKILSKKSNKLGKKN